MRSKTPSERRSRSLRELVFFIDESLGGHIVPDLIRASGRRAVAHNDLFAPGTDDVAWLSALVGSGYVLLTKDGRIRRRPLERLALRAARIDAFFLGNRQLPGSLMASAFVAALPRIERVVRAASGPVWGSIHADGRVSVIPSDA